jgi:hypothetical protein
MRCPQKISHNLDLIGGRDGWRVTNALELDQTRMRATFSHGLGSLCAQ